MKAVKKFDLEFLRHQYGQLRKCVDDNIAQRQRIQELALVMIAACYAWTILNSENIGNLGASAAFWIAWLPPLVVAGAGMRWFGHQFVIVKLARQMRSIEALFRVHASGSSELDQESLDFLSTHRVLEAYLGYESAIDSEYIRHKSRKFLGRFPVSVSELGIGIITMVLCIFVSLAISRAGEEASQARKGFLLEVGSFSIRLVQE